MHIGTLLEERRAEHIAKLVAPHISPSDRVLDFGAGTCKISEQLVRLTGAELVPVDIVDRNETGLGLTTYEGTSLPFGDEEFDVSLAFFSLHHCTDPAKTINELFRVTSKKLILFEDTPISRVGYQNWRWFDYMRNHWRDTRATIANHSFFRPGLLPFDYPKDKLGSKIDIQSHRSFILNAHLYTQSLIVVQIEDTPEDLLPVFYSYDTRNGQLEANITPRDEVLTLFA